MNKKARNPYIHGPVVIYIPYLQGESFCALPLRIHEHTDIRLRRKLVRKVCKLTIDFSASKEFIRTMCKTIPIRQLTEAEKLKLFNEYIDRLENEANEIDGDGGDQEPTPDSTEE